MEEENQYCLCPKCEAHNDPEQGYCRLCGQSLHLPDPIPVETVDATRFQLDAKRLGITLGLLGAILLPWFLMWDLFTTPLEVKESQKKYSSLRESYRSHKGVWQAQKNQILATIRSSTEASNPHGTPLSFRQLPLEVVMAYLEDDLNITPRRFPSLAWYPMTIHPHPSILLSKRKGWTTLSVALSFKETPHGMELVLEHLKRGKREVSCDLVWNFFGPELEALRSLQWLATGTRQLSFQDFTDHAMGLSSDPMHLSWEYRALR